MCRGQSCVLLAKKDAGGFRVELCRKKQPALSKVPIGGADRSFITLLGSRAESPSLLAKSNGSHDDFMIGRARNAIDRHTTNTFLDSGVHQANMLVLP